MFEDSIDRRSFVKHAGVVTLGSVAIAGCGGDGGGDGGNENTPTEADSGSGGSSDFGGWMSDAKNYDGVVDRTGKDQVTIDVGAGSSGLAFGPAAVRVSTGTEVVWKWTGKGGQHNVVGKNADFKSNLASEEGHTFSRTFDSAGTIKYYCNPHKTLGMKGVVVVE